MLLLNYKYLRQGFYYADGTPCEYADSKQISPDYYELQHDLYYVAKDGAIYRIKKGFVHDGASKGLLKRFGKYTNASILHDGLYGSHIVSQNEADDLFLEAMEFSKVAYFRRYTYYWVVWLVGEFAYDGKSEVTIERNRIYVMLYIEAR